MTKSQYKIILLLSLAIGLAGSFLDVAFPSLLTESLRHAQEEYDAAMPTSRILLALLVGLPGLGMAFVGTYGLYQFRSWAPRIALAGTALSLLALPIYGIGVQSGLSTSLLHASSYLWGASLTLSCFTPYKAWFAAEQGEA